jgi:Nucleotidyl transferase AbiEii toxin, Type IV TA system
LRRQHIDRREIQIMVQFDMQNSRMKDFYDIWILSRTLAISGSPLSQAIRATFNRRHTGVPVIPPVVPTAKAPAKSAEHPVRCKPPGPWQHG